MRRVVVLTLFLPLVGCTGVGGFVDLPAQEYVRLQGERASLANASIALGEDLFIIDIVGSRAASAQTFDVRATHAAGSAWSVAFRSVEITGPAGSGSFAGETRVEGGILLAAVPFTPSDPSAITQMDAQIEMATRHGSAPGQAAKFTLPFLLSAASG